MVFCFCAVFLVIAIELMLAALTFVEEYIMSIGRDSTEDLINKAGISFVNNLSFDIQSEREKKVSMCT